MELPLQHGVYGYVNVLDEVVSILVLMELPLQHRDYGHPILVYEVVSILVLMELPLQPMKRKTYPSE